MNRRAFIVGISALLAAPVGAEAQRAGVYRVGVVHQGGPYAQTVNGLREGLRELGLEEGKQVTLDVRDAQADLPAVEAAARSLEAAKVDLLVSVASSTTLAAKRATRSIPIVFYAGTDPVKLGLVASFRQPGGRLTGVHGQFTDVTAKRLELLKELAPGIRRALVLYDPAHAPAMRSLQNARNAAQQLGLTLVERPVASVGALRETLHALRPGEVDAIGWVNDAMVISQVKEVVDTAIARKLPAMVGVIEAVADGALSGYAASYRAIGQHLARYVQHVLLGRAPGSLPIEQLDRFYLVINLKTAKALGLTIPPSVLARADEVIE